MLSEQPGKPAGDLPRPLQTLITVKAAPNPSSEYGETVCVAGISLDPNRPGWIRLYPINFRYLDDRSKFQKYDIVTLKAIPARSDIRGESWRPLMDTLRVVKQLRGWPSRRPLVDHHVESSMCLLRRNIESNPRSRSLGLVRARKVLGLDLEPHPGWTREEQGKIDAYVSQLDLLSSTDRTPLQAPRLRGWYRWTCEDTNCRQHRQGILDWEFVALQRRFRSLPHASLCDLVRQKWLDEVCAPSREIAFYVGNQAKRPQTFSILGVYWPPHR